MADNKIQVLLEVDDKGTASLQRFGQVAEKVGRDGSRSLLSMGTAATSLASGLAALAGGVSLVQLGKSAFDAGLQMDSLNRAMTAIYGSSKAAAAEMEFLQATADRTGQNVYNLVESFNQFSASTKDTALEGENTRKVFSAMSEAASVLGMSNERAGRAFTALSQMASKGTISMEELRGQLGEALPGALNLFAKGMGVSTGELIELISKGKVGSEAMVQFADAVHQAYGEASEISGLQSAQAAVNKLSEEWFEFKVNLADMGTAIAAIHAVTEALKILNSILLSWDTGDAFAKLGAGFASLGDYAETSVDELAVTMGTADAAVVKITTDLDAARQRLAEYRAEGDALAGSPAMQGAAADVARLETALSAATKSKQAATSAAKPLAAATKNVADTANAAAKAATTTSKAKDTLAKSSNTAAKAAKDLAREEEALAREAEATGRAMIKAAADHRAATQELSVNLRKSLGEQLREEYAATAAGYDAREKLAEEHAEWINGLQDGLLRDIENGIGDFVYNFLTGEFDSIGDLFEGLCDSILRAFANLIAEMVAKWAMSGLVGLFTGQGFSGFNVGALGLGPGGILSGIGSGTGTGTSSLSQYGPYAAGYQFGPGAGTSAAVTGGQAAGAALGAAGGAYGLYSAASQASKGEAGVGTALQAGISAYALYKSYPTIAAYLSGLGGASTASTAASGITIAASDLTLIGPQTGGIGSAIAGGSGTTAAGGGAGAGLSTGAMVGGGAIMGIGALIAMGMGNKAQQEFYSPRYGNVPFNDYGHDDRRDLLRAGSAGYSWVSEAQPGSMSGSGDAGITQTVADLEAAFVQFEQNTRIVLDVLAAAGDGVASLGQQLEDGTLSTDAFVDAIAGYDVSIQDTANLTSLASDAARGNGNAMDALRGALQSMGLGADQAEVAALALVAASNNQSSALYAASSAAESAAGAISGMVSNINTLSRTPLNIRVNVGVREQPYRIDNSNPYAEHASGGIFSSPTLIPSIRGTRHLVGEAGAEAIMPLHAGPRTLQQMDAKLDALLSGGRPVQHVINLDGRTIAAATLPYVDAHVAAKATRGALTKRTVF
ncbi:MAG: tape measure protein [Kiritimatiellia bacterium]|jgi:tape measure domain-containing protein|nr:tape measure protein [Kiritimatiellia bacterium]